MSPEIGIILTSIPDYVGTILILLIGIGAGHYKDIQNKLGEEILQREILSKALQDKNSELQAQKQHFEALVQNTPMAIVTLDQDGTIRECNPAFSKLFEYDKNQVLGRQLDDLIVPDEFSAKAKSLTEAVDGGQRVHQFSKRQTKTGKLVDVEDLWSSRGY